MASRPVVVFRVAWMVQYRGVTATDIPMGGGAYVKEKRSGHEAFNFAPYKNSFFGFVQIEGKGVNLKRLGVSAHADSLEGVTVIWVATHPQEGGMRVVGWYEDATVFAKYQSPPTSKRRLPNGNVPWYLATATRATLLGRDERVHNVPRASATQTGMGRSNIWYPNRDDAARLLRYLGRMIAPTRPRTRAPIPRLIEVERRQRIEREAMTITAQWFVDHGYTVEDMSMQHLGWDLEARRGRGCLRVEVKGTSLEADSFAVEVTPNEYLNMCDPAKRGAFRVCVVSDCESNPTLEIYAWSTERRVWSTGDGTRKLIIDEIVGARLRGVSA